MTENSKEPVLDRHDTFLAAEILRTVHGSFLMGSYPVLKMEARDIDVAVPEAMWGAFTKLWGTRFDLTHNADEEVYTDDAPAFLANYRNLDGGRVNVLIIRDRYVGAMMNAAAVAAAEPEYYKDATVRIALYQAWERGVS